MEVTKTTKYFLFFFFFYFFEMYGDSRGQDLIMFNDISYESRHHRNTLLIYSFLFIVFNMCTHHCAS